MKNEYQDRYQQFGLNVVYYRKKEQLSQTQLVELVDIHRTYVSSIELGKVSVSFDVLSRLTDALDVPYSRFVDKSVKALRSAFTLFFVNRPPSKTK